ncbi:hypothetical protein KUTeg_014227 [Tegillarca granosa]|uniref:Uncharacterized protein n=1 Tax=Tegillarca granosa TaxID=220873 RepID=A0ABQ9EW16_TEGGR|nr:hypothetical protein KUTeg_014227 [Tegillarca granosa]
MYINIHIYQIFQEQEQAQMSSQGQAITIQPHQTAVQQAVTQQQQALQNLEPSPPPPPPPPQQQAATHHPWQEHVQQVSPISPVTSVGLVLPTSPVQPSRIWHNNPSPGSSSSDKNLDDASKPVVCSLCDRRFKNIPALNGHMRLHGGYFKKEGKEEKKSKKNVGGNKDMGPPPPIVKQNRSNSAAMKLPNVPQHAFQQQLDQVSSPPGTQASGGVMIPEDIQSPVSEGTVPVSHSDVVSMIQHLQQYQAHHQIQVGVGYWTSVDSVDYHYQQQSQAQQDLTPHSSVPQSPDIAHQDLSHLSNQQQDLSHISAQLHLQQLAQQQQQRDLTQQLDLNLSSQDIELNLLQHQSVPQIQSPPLSLSSVSIQSNLQDAIAQIPQFALPTPTSANEIAAASSKSFVSSLQLAAGQMKLVTTTENQDLAVAQMLQSLHDNSSSTSLSAATIPFFKQDSLPQDTKEEEEQPPETDVLPHVNIGPQYQAEIPAYNSNRSGLKYVTCKEDLVWDPSSMKDEEDVQYYHDFATCAAVKGNGANVEYAMHLLHMAKGNIQDAMLALMDGSSKLPVNHTLLTYKYQDHLHVIEAVKSLRHCLIEGKTCRQCVQLYYLWKKVCPDEHKRLRIIRRKREQEELYNIRTRQQQEQSQAATSTAPAAVSNQMEGTTTTTEQDAYSDLDSDSSIDNYDQMDKDDDMLSSSSVNASPASFRASPAPVFSCDYPECNATFTSKKALSGHVRIHGGGLSNKTVPVLPPPQETLEFRGPGRPAKPQTSTPNKTQATVSETGESFPCKLCGRVFAKVKSRSAHMKSHRVVDGDKNKVKQQKTLPPTTNKVVGNKVAITLNNIQESPNG